VSSAQSWYRSPNRDAGSRAPEDAMTRRATVLAVVSMAAFAAGCGATARGGGETELSDAAIETADDAAPDAPASERSYARVIAGPADLLGGPGARGVEGDIVIGNRFVRYVIRTGDRGMFGPCGGVLLDADLVRPEGQPGRDRLIELFPMVGMARVLCPDTISVADDGAATGTAVVRLRGPDGGFPLIESLVPTLPLGLDVTMDYVLPPDARHLEVVFSIRNTTGFEQDVVAGQVVQFGDTIDFFADRCGFDPSCVIGRKDVDWIGGGSPDVSYGFTTPAGSRPLVLLNEDALLIVRFGVVTIAAGGEAEVRHYFVTGDGTLEDVVRQVRALRGVTGLGRLVATVTPAGTGTAPSDALLTVGVPGEGGATTWHSSSRAGADGKATFDLPPGAYDVKVEMPGTVAGLVQGIAVKAGEDAPAAVPVAAPGGVALTVKDGDGKPLDALLQLQAGHDAAWTAGTIGRPFFVRDGVFEAPVPPGKYTAVVSKGFAWDAWSGNVTVTAGAKAPIAAALHKVVATDGELSMDTHDHCELSNDAQITVEDRLRNAMAVGLDVYSTTDHDHMGNLQPWVESMGVTDRVRALPGSEISPTFGHTAAIGCDVKWIKDTYFEVPWVVPGPDGTIVRTTPTRIWNTARKDFACRLLLIAHPWDGSSGLLNNWEVTDTSDPAEHLPDMDLSLVDGLEVVNGGQDWNEMVNVSLPRWFNMLRRGYRVAAVGGSDAHEPSAALGDPRNLVPAGGAKVDALDPAVLYDAIREFRSQVVGGPVIRLTVGGEKPGGVAAAPGGVVKARLEVHAAPWVPVDVARIYVNGEMVVEEAVAPGTAVVRAVIDRDLAVTQDAFVVAAAGHRTERQGVAVSNRPSRSVTNPVWVDADGNGYRAPGPKPR